MSAFVQSLMFVIDPRGRCNRKALLIVFLTTLALQVGIASAFVAYGVPFTGPLATAAKLAFCWIALSVTCQRLHDAGISALWLLWSILGLIVWAAIVPLAAFLLFGPILFNPSQAVFATTMGIVYVPVLALAIWMHFVEGEPHDNRFGAMPGALGFSGPWKRDEAMSHDPQGPLAA